MTATQDFADLSLAVFGGVVDAEALWGEVSKMNPGPSDVHVPGSISGRGRRATGPGALVVRRKIAKRRTLTPEERRARQEMERKVAQASNVVGLGAGAAGTYAAATSPQLRGKVGAAVGGEAPKLLTRRGKRMAGAALGLQAANVVGDAVTARVLGRKDVQKADLKSLVQGALAQTRALTGFKPKPPAQKPVAGSGTKPKTYGPGLKPTQAQGARWERKAQAGLANAQPRRAAQAATPNPTVVRNNTQAPNVMARTQGDVSGALVSARQAQARRVTMANAKPNAATRNADRGASVKQDFNNALGTTTGKVALGGLGALALNGARKRSQGGGGGDPYSYYGKRAPIDDVELEGTFSKLDEDKRLAFGWASVVSVNGAPVVDRQGDYISPEDLEDAAYVYVEKSRVGGSMHRRVSGKSLLQEDRPHHVADMVESMVFTPEKIAKMGLPSDFPVGWWVGYRYFDDDAWADIKEGRHTGFSIHGKGIRKNVEFDSLMEG